MMSGSRSSAIKPAIPRGWLFAIAAAAWLTAGSILCARALIWLADDPPPEAIVLALAGTASGLLFYRFLFRRVAGKNIIRICRLPERPCLFAFTAWKGYLMIGGMVTTGILLRGSSLPREVLIVPYTAMGGALIIAASRFAGAFWSVVVRRRPCPGG